MLPVHHIVLRYSGCSFIHFKATFLVLYVLDLGYALSSYPIASLNAWEDISIFIICQLCGRNHNTYSTKKVLHNVLLVVEGFQWDPYGSWYPQQMLLIPVHGGIRNDLRNYKQNFVVRWLQTVRCSVRSSSRERERATCFIYVLAKTFQM